MSKGFKSNPHIEKMRMSQGQDVPVDYFLYACFETEKTMAADKSQIRIQWPTLTDFSPEDLQEEIGDQRLEDLFGDLMSWYSANHPDLTAGVAWDYSTLATIVPPLVSMVKDSQEIYKKKTGEDFPEFPETEDALAKEPWSIMAPILNRLFGRKSEFILRYIGWCFGPNKDQPLNPSRPPVGRFAPGARGNRPPRDSGGRSGNSRDGGARGGNNRDGGGRGGNNRDGGARGGNNRGGRGGNNRDGGRQRGPRRDGGGRGRQPSDPEMEKIALAECDTAYDTLNSNPDQDQVVLRPQNSFYRRIQHQHIVENGFESQSTGEGHDRAVVVMRKA